MSAIFGLVNFDGAPASSDYLSRMQQAMAYWGADGGGIWQEDNIGLGSVLRVITPEDRYETLPLTHASPYLVLTASARLDNREELCQILAIPSPDRPRTPDSCLLLRAYERWGLDCPEHLVGDWSFALWDKPQRRLVLARDHHGNTSFFYYHNSRFLAFASALKGLLALPEVPQRPNSLRLARTLTSWSGGEGVQTAYADIHRLAPAHILTVNRGQISKRRYWQVENTPELHLPRQEEYQEQFLELYKSAVHCRLRSLRPVGATLSGGLDSGSVCTLASRDLAQVGLRLPVFSSVPLVNTASLTPRGRFGNESDYIEATARWAGNIDVTYITAAEVSPLAGIRRFLELQDEPGHAAANFYWITALLDQARKARLGALLTGQLGNATVSWTGGPIDLWGLLLSGKWPELHKEVQSLPGPQPFLAFWSLVRNQVLRPLVHQGRSIWYSWQERGREPWESYAAINRNWARSLNLTQRMRLSGHDPTFTPNSNFQQHRLKIIGPGRSTVGHLWGQTSAGYGLEVRDPTMDKRLMEFCLSVPNYCYYHRGKERLLLRQSLAELMPPQVLWNRRKGLQAADIGHRVLASAEEIEAVLRQLAHSGLGRHYLDLPKMSRVLASVKTEVNRRNSQECVTILLRGLMVGLFLLRF